MNFKQVEYQNWANFKELKTWFIYNFKREYVTNKLCNQLIKIVQTLFTNYNTADIYEKEVENGRRKRYYY